mmetsp:Transcript_20110/g.55539  ORF Transcript_20110/g.55539 Transcript_20110/m.55539 type:complete len:121 (+) Transcript_20110:275-637(+)
MALDDDDVSSSSRSWLRRKRRPTTLGPRLCQTLVDEPSVGARAGRGAVGCSRVDAGMREVVTRLSLKDNGGRRPKGTTTTTTCRAIRHRLGNRPARPQGREVRVRENNGGSTTTDYLVAV